MQERAFFISGQEEEEQDRSNEPAFKGNVFTKDIFGNFRDNFFAQTIFTSHAFAENVFLADVLAENVFIEKSSEENLLAITSLVKNIFEGNVLPESS